MRVEYNRCNVISILKNHDVHSNTLYATQLSIKYDFLKCLFHELLLSNLLEDIFYEQWKKERDIRPMKYGIHKSGQGKTSEDSLNHHNEKSHSILDQRKQTSRRDESKEQEQFLDRFDCTELGFKFLLKNHVRRIIK